MERLQGWLEVVRARLDAFGARSGGLPNLPPPPDPVLLLALATVLSGLGLMALVTGWIDRRVSLPGVLALLLGLGMFVWVRDGAGDAWSLRLVPEAFIELVARVIR